MQLIQEWTVQCPYCGADNTLSIEPLSEPQDYVEDCEVCCQPMRIRVRVADGIPSEVDVTRENG